MSTLWKTEDFLAELIHLPNKFGTPAAGEGQGGTSGTPPEIQHQPPHKGAAL